VSSLNNGLVLSAWNVLRVLITTTTEGWATIDVWLNPMFHETGFVGDPNVDSGQTPMRLPARISFVDDSSPGFPAGGVAVAAGGSAVQIDYVAVLPPEAL
jgi:hypothetical protein